jgi:hypothetical protein
VRSPPAARLGGRSRRKISLGTLPLGLMKDRGRQRLTHAENREWIASVPEQIITSLVEAMRGLTSPTETGAVTLSLPQDVQAEAYDFPVELFRERVWTIRRAKADSVSLARAAELIRRSEKP